MQNALKALILDDHKENRDLYKEHLNELGIISVETNGNIAEVLQIIKDSLLTNSATNLKILVVDDSATSVKCAKHVLRTRLGHHVDEANSGAKALKIVRNSIQQGEPFDAVFVDFVMTSMDGPTTTKELKGIGFMGPIIGFTGLSQLDNSKFIAAGACMVLEKPLQPYKPLQPHSIFRLLTGVYRIYSVFGLISQSYIIPFQFGFIDLQAVKTKSSLALIIIAHKFAGMDGPTAALRVRNLGYNGLIIGIVDGSETGLEGRFKQCGATILRGSITSEKLACIISGSN